MSVPREVARELSLYEEEKNGAGASYLLNNLAERWSCGIVSAFADYAEDEADLVYICTTAFLFRQTNLYFFLAINEILPFKLTYDSNANEWRAFMNRLFEMPKIIVAISLRFFRSDGYEYLWEERREYLMDLAGSLEICDYTSGLGSITRIIWNTSSDVDRPRNLNALVGKVWRSYLIKMKGREESEAYKRVFRLNATLLDKTMEFGDKTTWTEHAVRNLLINSIVPHTT